MSEKVKMLPYGISGFAVAPENMLDVGTKTDNKKMGCLVELDGMGERECSLIRQIAAAGSCGWKRSPESSL